MTDKKLYTGKITIHEVFVEKPPGWFRKIGDGPWESVSLVPYNGMLPVVWMKPSAEPGLQQRETWSDPRVLAEAREVSLPPQSAYFMQATGEGVCFAHGPYKNADRSSNCPKWPACITDPQKPEYLAISKAEGSLDRNPNAPCKNCGHPWDEEVAEAQQAMREGSLRTPAAPQIAERIACQLDIDEPGTSPETHAYNVRWITAIIESARGEASQPASLQAYSSAPGPQWQAPAKPSLIETLGQTAPGAVPWSPVEAEAPAQPSPVKICKQCGKPFTDTTMWQLRVSCDECTFWKKYMGVTA